MKRILTISLVLLLALTFPFSAYAEHGDEQIETGTVVDIEYLDNGDYIETVMEDDEFIIIPGDSINATTVRKTKTKNYKNSAGNVLWSVSVQGTFTYNGSTSSCTKAAHSAASYASSWTIRSASSSKSGNKATATATARHQYSTGYNDYTRSVTLTCSATGVFT